MNLKVSFIFGGNSTEYDASISSLTHIIYTYLSISKEERPFSVKHLYHISRDDGLLRTIPLHSAFTVSELKDCMSAIGVFPGHRLPAILDTIASRNEYIVNLLHGQFGEDGGAQTLAALSGLRGTFGDPHVASLTMNKYAMASFVSSLLPADVVRVPKTMAIKPKYIDNAIQFTKSIQGPIVVKPNSLGSSLFTKVFHEPVTSEADIVALIKRIFNYDGTALLQEFISGDEYSCGCLVDASGVTPLPVVKIETDRHFFGHDEKHSRGLAVEKIVDGRDAISDRLKSITRIIASSMDLYNMARFDFRIAEKLEIYFLECNYIPGLMKNSIFPKMLNSNGMTVIDLISWIASNSNSFSNKNRCVVYDIHE